MAMLNNQMVLLPLGIPKSLVFCSAISLRNIRQNHPKCTTYPSSWRYPATFFAGSVIDGKKTRIVVLSGHL